MKSSVLPVPKQYGSRRTYLRTPLRRGHTVPDVGMRGVTLLSTSPVLVVHSDGPGPSESAHPRKADGYAGRPRGFTHNLSLLLGRRERSPLRLCEAKDVITPPTVSWDSHREAPHTWYQLEA